MHGRRWQTSAAAHRQVWVLQLCNGEGICSHVLGPVARVYDRIIDDAQKSIKPESLFLVLDEPYLAAPGVCLCAGGTALNCGPHWSRCSRSLMHADEWRSSTTSDLWTKVLLWYSETCLRALTLCVRRATRPGDLKGRHVVVARRTSAERQGGPCMMQGNQRLCLAWKKKSFGYQARSSASAYASA